MYLKHSNEDIYWRVRAENYLGNSDWSDFKMFTTGELMDINEEKLVISQMFLHQNFPNPFNPSTTIQYELASAGKVKLTLYDLLGREIETLADEEMHSGTHRLEFNADKYSLSSGVYFVKMDVYQNGSSVFRSVRKLNLIK